jgi:O-antigen/teichoic acid export membrane protein
LAAPWIARFYQQDKLCDILRVSALGLLIGSLNVVHSIRFTRRLDFRIPTIVSLCGTLMMGLSGIAFALLGYGVWSLVWSSLIRSTVSCAILWSVARWRPTLEFSRHSMRHIASFGGPLLTASLLDGIFSNLHTILIGKLFSAADLGFFNRGNAVQSIAVQTSLSPLLGVLFPTFSKLQHDLPRLAKAYFKTLRVTAFVLSPVLFGLASVATPLVTIVYGTRWLPSVPYLFWLACFGVWLPLSTIGFSVLKSLGKGGRFLRMSMTRHAMVVAGMLAGLPFGIQGLIIGMGIGQILVFASLTWALRGELGIRFVDTVAAVLPPLAISLVALGLASLVHPQAVARWPQLFAAGGVFACAIIVLLAVIRPRALSEVALLLAPIARRIPGGSLLLRLTKNRLAI